MGAGTVPKTENPLIGASTTPFGSPMLREMLVSSTLICSIGQPEFCAALEARLNIVQDVATCKTKMEFRRPRMVSIFRAWSLLPDGYDGTQMGTKNGSRFGSQFMMCLLPLFWIWGAAFADNFAAQCRPALV